MKRAILVMGGGGMKGLAHIGAWKAVQEAELEVVGLIGTSIGALVGGCIGGGAGWGDLVSRALGVRRRDVVSLNFAAFLINGLRQPSVFHGHALRELIESALPAGRFEELRIPLAVNAVDLETGRMEWFGAGGRMDVSLADAVYASCALPLFYPPAEIGGRYYVDGGVGDALPIGRAADQAEALAANVVVAVDVGSGPVKDPLDTVSSGLVAVHHRVFGIMSYAAKQERLARWQGPPLSYIRPRLDGYSTFDFQGTKYFLEEGYRATRRALAELTAGRPVPMDRPVAAES
jgi:NTE family protein